jgi:hypothetical protein
MTGVKGAAKKAKELEVCLAAIEVLDGADRMIAARRIEVRCAIRLGRIRGERGARRRRHVAGRFRGHRDDRGRRG